MAIETKVPAKEDDSTLFNIYRPHDICASIVYQCVADPESYIILLATGSLLTIIDGEIEAFESVPKFAEWIEYNQESLSGLGLWRPTDLTWFTEIKE